MRVTVKLFAVAKDITGSSEISVDVDDSSTIADLRNALGQAHPELLAVLPMCRFSVDNQFAAEAQPVTPGSEIACLPPVSGG